jgi:hypothetical protein
MPYRADDVALNERRELLEGKLSDLRARAKELGDVNAEEKRTIAELDAIRRRLGAGRRLPMLDNVRVASPCKASWDEMTGDEQVRFCGHCEKNVYNLSAMTREAAASLIAQKEGRMCVRFYQRADGTVLTADCPVGVRRRRVRRFAMAAVGGGLLTAAATMMGARTKCGVGSLDTHAVMGAMPAMPMMGEMVAPPPPTVTSSAEKPATDAVKPATVTKPHRR